MIHTSVSDTYLFDFESSLHIGEIFAGLNDFSNIFGNVAIMASEGEDPPPDALTKFYKCHPQTRVGVVVCILCINFYHTNEIVCKYNSGCPVKIINKALIICPDHPNEALTSNISYGALSCDARQLITQIKLSTRE